MYRQPSEPPDSNEEPEQLPNVPNPRQVHAQLDEFVIAQDRAKRILSVAVHNHQLRVQAVLRARREAERRAEFEAMERERKERELEEHQAGSAEGPSRSRRVTPQAVEASIQLDEASSSRRPNEQQLSRRRSGARRPNSEDDEGTDVEIATFSPSYQPSSRPRGVSSDDGDDIDPATSRMLRQRLAVLADRDKGPSARRRKPTLATEREGEGEVLSDFAGQQSGHSEPRPLLRSSSMRTSSAADELPFEKSNVILLGPTGVGKSLLARTVAKQLDVPYSESCATTFTQAGYVGDDVESAVVRLLQEADGDVDKASRGVIFIDGASSHPSFGLGAMLTVAPQRWTR